VYGRYRPPVTQRPLYHSHAWAYDAVVARPGGPEARAVAAALEGRCRTVLDAGCGSGRYAAELARLGFRVTGVDRSEELVAIARERAPRAVFDVGDLCTWTPADRFDAALCRGVLNDCITDGERGGVVAGLRRAVRDGGVLVADVRDWEPSVAHYREHPVFERRAVTERGLVEFRSTTEIESERRILRVRERISVDGVGADNAFAMRCWTRAEFEAALRDAGFADLDFDALAPRRADRLVVVARATP
jgi:SAM-dependent methyltransferase